MDRMNDFENLILVQSIRKVITMEHEELASRIIGCAFYVYNRMGFEFLEKRKVRVLDGA